MIWLDDNSFLAHAHLRTVENASAPRVEAFVSVRIDTGAVGGYKHPDKIHSAKANDTNLHITTVQKFQTKSVLLLCKKALN